MKLFDKSSVRIGITASICTISSIIVSAEEAKPAVEEKKLTPVEFYAASYKQPEKVEWLGEGSAKSVFKAGSDTGNAMAATAGIGRLPSCNFPIGFKTKFAVGNFLHRFHHLKKVHGVHSSSYHINDYATDTTENPLVSIVTLSLHKQHKLALNLGRFDSWIGLENGDDAIGMNATGGFIGANDCYPGDSTGTYLSVNYSDKINGNIYLTNGWSTAANNYDHARAGGARVRFVPNKETVLAAAVYFGRDGGKRKPGDTTTTSFGTIQFPNPGLTPVTVLNAYATHKFACKWTAGVDVFHASSKCPNKGKWYGGGLYLLYQLNDKTKLGLKADYLKDQNGLVWLLKDEHSNRFVSTGAGSVSFGVRHNLSPKQEIRAEVKARMAKHKILPNGKKSDWDFTFAQIYKV